MAAEPLVEEFEQFIPRLVPQSEPQPDPMVDYPGQGAVQLWNDVYHYATSIIHFFGRSGPSVGYVLTDQLNEAVDAATGATIKALSGYINRAAQIGLDAQQWASMELDAMSSNIGAIYQYFDDRLNVLDAFRQAMVRLAIPSLQHQILQLRHDMNLGFQYNSVADRAWATDNIFRPLTESIGQVASEIPVWANGAYERATDYTDLAVGALGVNVLRELVPLTHAVAALQTEAEECTQPMCNTLGPKTDLGKLLKAVKVAGWAALLVEIAALRADGLEGLLADLEGWAQTAIHDLETLFFQGGRTLGETLTAIA